MMRMTLPDYPTTNRRPVWLQKLLYHFLTYWKHFFAVFHVCSGDGPSPKVCLRFSENFLPVASNIC